jgi:MraZ protein
MASESDLILGEFLRTLDDRFRLSVPNELADFLAPAGSNLILAKERLGCLSLWSAPLWQSRLDAGIALVKSKIQAGKLEGRTNEVQLLGRLLSTRHKTVQFSDRGRLLVPEGFREFLGVEPNGTVVVIGAAVCIELWRPDRWQRYIERRISRFRGLFDRLSG